LLTGQLPFQGTVMSVLGQILTEEPRRLTELRPDLDPALEVICLKAMSKKAEDRYGSMTEFATALGDYLRAGSGKSAPSQVAPPAGASSDEPTAAEANEKATESGLATELLGRLLDRLEIAPTAAPQEPRRSRALFWLVTIVLFLVLGGIGGGVLAYRYMPRTQDAQTPQTPPPPQTVVVELRGLTERINNPAVTQLFLDGDLVTRQFLASAVHLKPGPHELVLKNKDGIVIERLTFTVGEQDRQEVQLVKPPPSVPKSSDPDLPDLKPTKLTDKDIRNRELLEEFFTIREIKYDAGNQRVRLTCEAKKDIDYVTRAVPLCVRLYDADDARIGFDLLNFGSAAKVAKGASVQAIFYWQPARAVKKVLLDTRDEKTYTADRRAPLPPIDAASLLGGVTSDFKQLEESFVILKGSHDRYEQRFTLLLEARRYIEYVSRDVRLRVRFYDAKGKQVREDLLRYEQDSYVLKGERVMMHFRWGLEADSRVTRVAIEPTR
jgi:hypothetical protein